MAVEPLTSSALKWPRRSAARLLIGDPPCQRRHPAPRQGKKHDGPVLQARKLVLRLVGSPGVDVCAELFHGAAEPCECIRSKDEHQRWIGAPNSADDRLGCPGWIAGLVVVLCGVRSASSIRSSPDDGMRTTRRSWSGPWPLVRSLTLTRSAPGSPAQVKPASADQLGQGPGGQECKVRRRRQRANANRMPALTRTVAFRFHPARLGRDELSLWTRGISQARPEARSEVGNSLSGKTRPGTPGPTLIPKRIRHYGSNERIG